MPRYIDSDDAIYELKRAFPIDDFGKIVRCISRTPTADVVERKEADYWHEKANSYEHTILMLSQSAQERSRWIPVTERLPETDEMMLVTCQPKKGLPNVNRAYYMDGSWHGSGSMSSVTAWMPLPEPWKGEADV